LALTRARKEELVAEYGERIAKAQVMIWANYSGSSVAQMGELRSAVRKAGAESVVVRNNLMRLALEQADMPMDSEVMSGTRLVTFVYGDIGAASKALVDFASANDDVFEVVGGVSEGAVIDQGQVKQLTLIPSREVLLSQVVGGMQAPISGFVGTLAAVVRSMLNVVNARREQLEGAAA